MNDSTYHGSYSQKYSVSAIVPAFNEEKTIAGVLTALLDSRLVDEVICVNDGSTDSTAAVVQKFDGRIRFLNFRKNHGKGFALAQGVKAARGDFVLFLDADIINLKENYIRTLLTPLLKDDALEGVIGAPYRYRASLYFPFNVYLSGQRAYRKICLLRLLSEMEGTRFGVEVYLNAMVPKKKTRIVYLKGFSSLQKYEKYQPEEAAKEAIKGLIEISRVKGKMALKPYFEYYRSELAPYLNQELRWEDLKFRFKDLHRIRDLLR